MISSNTRASRSASRFSSPAQQQQQQQQQKQASGKDATASLDGSRGTAGEGSRSFLQRWLEPSVQSRPSFEEAGLMRYGVLENMAPLGALPKAKKASGDVTQPVKRIILKTPAMAAAKAAAEQDAAGKVEGDDEVPLMTMSPPASPLLASTPTTKRKAPAAKTKTEEVGDDEYDPTAMNGRRRSRRVLLPVKRSTPAAAAIATTTATATTTTTATAAAAVSPPLPLPPVPLPPTIQPPTQPSSQPSSMHERRRSSSSIAVVKATTPKRQTRSDVDQQAITGRIVDAAVGEALKHYRYPTAWALRTLYDEKHGDADFVAMIEDVFSQTADKETMEEFFRQMETRKREGKKENRACYHFVPPTTNSRFTPHKPKAAPYTDLIHEPDELPRRTSGKRAAKKAKLSHGVVARPAGAVADPDATTDMTTDRSAVMTKTMPASATTTTTTTTTTTPRRRGADGDAGQPKGIIEVKTPGSRKRARRDSASSDSSLSTALSLSSPEIRASSLSSPTAYRRLGARTEAARTEAGGGRRGGGRGGDGAGAAAATAPTAATLGGPRRAAASGAASAASLHVHSSSATSAGAKSQTVPAPQPIKTRRKSLASSKQTASSSSRSKSPTLGHTGRLRPLKPLSASPAPSAPSAPSAEPVPDDASMPGRVSAAELFSNLDTKTAEQSFLSSTNADGGHSAAAAAAAARQAHIHMPEEDENASWDRRRSARRVTNGISAKESAVRGPDAEAEVETTPVRTTRRTRQSLAASVTTRASRSASKRPTDDEVDRNDSPIALSLTTGDGNSSVGSRAATPTSLRPAKKQKTGLRVKSSPVKKKGGTAAGVPRPVNEATSSASNGNSAKDAAAENDENCSACGNTGDVVCCDGCPRSFHFECVDMVRSDHLPDEWYCNECLIRRYPSRVPVHRGILGSALNNLEKSIPRAFSLPKSVQNRFEGVKAGADGDYEELVTNKPAKKRNGYDELPDFFKQREDGQAVLCHGCQKSATEIRAIIPCSACPYHWHIDCLDPPLAVPPVLKTWRCPAHIDDILIEVPSLAPAHRFRKVKASQTISPAISRGVRNNGYIEVDWDGFESEEADHSGWTDVSSFGRTYKLPAKGVILDFIEQLRNKGAGYGPRQAESKVITHALPPLPPDSAGPARGSALDRKVEEMQVCLNLISLKQRRSDGIEQLTSALLAAADQNVLSLMAQSNADNIALNQVTDTDRLGLRAMLAQMEAMSSRIRQVLGEEEIVTPRTPPALTSVKAEVSSPVTESTAIGDLHHIKSDALPPLTEPTPPSTVDHTECHMEVD
ncbi:hypothetical protein E4U54_002468 [Claviceps lovelessii]|nr:hypothetical protein E4U54_002468 [Claviceps lovelessii]